MSPTTTLARWHMLRLVAAFIGYAVVLAVLFTVLMALPMSRRAADDLAGLMVLSAQTWAELPPETRSAFEAELRQSHGLLLAERIEYQPIDVLHRPFAYQLEAALARRAGQTVHLHAEAIAGETWYWVNLPAGDGTLAIGLPQRRYNGQPMLALVGGLLVGIVLAVALSAGLARRLARPIRRVERAMDAFSVDADAAPLRETGIREIASLGRHFNAMTQQIRELLASRTLLLAGVSHDLRTPLARMRLALELARSTQNAARFDALERDIGRMDALIGQALDLARGLGREPPEPVPIGAFLVSLVADHPAVVIENEAPDRVRAAPVALGRALANLLENAERYAPGTVTTLRAETLSGGVRIGVLDRGPGIPPERVGQMLEPFQRLEPSRSPVTGGSGLGLSIVRELARANGWTLDIHNRDGGGLAVWIVLSAPEDPMPPPGLAGNARP